MNLHSMGISIRHEDTFGIDRPYGSGDNLLIIFKSDAIVWMGTEQIKVQPGSFIIYTKDKVQKYGADNKPYMNHYVHFNSIDERFFTDNGIWTDRPGYLQNIEEVENLLRLLGREQISETEYRAENISLFLQLLFRKIGENQCESPAHGNDQKHLEELTSLRSEMYSTPGRFKSIGEMSAAVNLSLSHFQALYHSFFGVSCYEDLLNARMVGSKGFLINSELSIHEIANLCGYESDTCFMRCFKKREGMTPSEYRRSYEKK